ncbi:MAG: SPOR domain-containing protein [Sulfuricella sp.]|nr:SPOR domain-containing protein [Sulfuricella sp.]
MSRDYKQSDRRAAKKGGSPLFTGVLIGLFVGLAVAIGVAVYINFSPKPFVSRDQPKPPAEAGKAPVSETALPPENPAGSPDKAEKPAGKPRFDFYTILPGSEEPATEHDLKQDKKPEGAAKEAYFLQVGSFQAATEADNMKARLALLGLEASIQTADIPDKGVWHRVRIGPFTNTEDMNRARALLAQNNLSASLIKVRDAAAP